MKFAPSRICRTRPYSTWPVSHPLCDGTSTVFRTGARSKLNWIFRKGFLDSSMRWKITIFRLVQECLTNIHRHSGSDTAKIAIRIEQHHLVVRSKTQAKASPCTNNWNSVPVEWAWDFEVCESD